MVLFITKITVIIFLTSVEIYQNHCFYIGFKVYFKAFQVSNSLRLLGQIASPVEWFSNTFDFDPLP
jgi:energy-converting hydrogenase Eha subunit B